MGVCVGIGAGGVLVQSLLNRLIKKVNGEKSM